MANNAYYFYVLLCHDQTFYGGYTSDPERRLSEHNSGTGAKYTRIKKKLPVTMIYQERFSTKSEAMKAEYAFKKLTRQKKEQFLTNKNIEFTTSIKNT